MPKTSDNKNNFLFCNICLRKQQYKFVLFQKKNKYLHYEERHNNIIDIEDDNLNNMEYQENIIVQSDYPIESLGHLKIKLIKKLLKQQSWPGKIQLFNNLLQQKSEQIQNQILEIDQDQDVEMEDVSNNNSENYLYENITEEMFNQRNNQLYDQYVYNFHHDLLIKKYLEQTGLYNTQKTLKLYDKYDPYEKLEKSNYKILNNSTEFRFPDIQNKLNQNDSYIKSMQLQLTLSSISDWSTRYSHIKIPQQDLFTETQGQIGNKAINIFEKCKKYNEQLKINITPTEIQLNHIYKILEGYDKGAIPYLGDIKNFQHWRNIGIAQKRLTGKKFQVVLLDPAYCITSKKQNPKNKKWIVPYDTLSDEEIINLPLHEVQDEGYLMLWICNQKRDVAYKLLEKNGYKHKDTVIWVKVAEDNTVLRGNGKLTRHAMEELWICAKGNLEMREIGWKPPNVIVSRTRKVSQKPDEQYSIAESLVPNGYYLEGFARSNNFRKGFISFGNQL